MIISSIVSLIFLETYPGFLFFSSCFLVSAETAFYNETEIAVNITEVEELINETVIVPVQVTPTGT